jgi:hexosaminidase
MNIKKIVLTLAFLIVFINVKAQFKVVACLPNWFWALDEQLQENKVVRQAAPKITAPNSDFKVKGFHLDLRIQVMKMPALKEFALKLSKNGINTLVMEWEATYPFEKHNVITGKFAYSRADIKSFVAYCKTLKIDVIPLQQSFGHVEYILRNHRYKELREDQKDYSQVNPIRVDSCKALFTDLYKDLISTHDSPYLHIGGDETYLLGRGEESKKKVAAVGMGRLYGDYIKMLCDVVVSLGKKPIVWADIALHYPEALKGLPKETIFVDWNYGWPLDRFGDHEQLMKSGFEIWGSPAIRSAQDNYFLTDWNKHFENIKTFIPQAKDLGYKGVVMTSWSTSGLYSNVLESSTEVIDLVAIRRVYPISGFNMLIDAYFKSLLTAKPLAAEDFVSNYAKENYGFDQKKATLFWNALKRAPFEINQGKVSKPQVSIANLLDSAKLSVSDLKSLKPSKNQAEFEHYLLMSDIRVFYLQCMHVEDEMNSTSFKFSDAPRLLKLLNDLHPEKLNSRFKALNKDLMFEAEIDLENTLRNERLNHLKLKLNNQK